MPLQLHRRQVWLRNVHREHRADHVLRVAPAERLTGLGYEQHDLNHAWTRRPPRCPCRCRRRPGGGTWSSRGPGASMTLPSAVGDHRLQREESHQLPGWPRSAEIAIAAASGSVVPAPAPRLAGRVERARARRMLVMSSSSVSFVFTPDSVWPFQQEELAARQAGCREGIAPRVEDRRD